MARHLLNEKETNMIASPETLSVEPQTASPALAAPAKPDGEPNQQSRAREQADPAETSDPSNRTLHLIGRPTLKQFLRFVAREAVDPEDEATLIAEWQAAKEHVQVLEKEEAGHADKPHVTPIDVHGKYEPLLVDFLKDPLVQQGYNIVPTEVAFVNLDDLVVYQYHIDLTFVDQLKRKLGPAPDDEQIFRACLPYDHPHPPAKCSRVDDNTYVFMSPSNDLRVLGNMRLIKEQPSPGTVGVVGLTVGFGSNFLNAFLVEGRLILHNGSHRAYALREMGFKTVPCIVQHISTRDELDVIAASPIRRDPDNFLKHPRPSMLKDYFNPKLRKIVEVHRRLRQIMVKIQVEEAYVPGV